MGFLKRKKKLIKTHTKIDGRTLNRFTEATEAKMGNKNQKMAH